jgi:hypothetical protein
VEWKRQCSYQLFVSVHADHSEVKDRVKGLTEKQALERQLTETRIREKLDRADDQHKAHVAAIRRKAISENMKARRLCLLAFRSAVPVFIAVVCVGLFTSPQVSEVEFINSVMTETKRQLIQRKMDESESRRKGHIAAIVAKQGELQSKVEVKLQQVRQKEAQDIAAKRESIGQKLEYAEARRQYVGRYCWLSSRR